jgi:hypothetical protein
MTAAEAAKIASPKLVCLEEVRRPVGLRIAVSAERMRHIRSDHTPLSPVPIATPMRDTLQENAADPSARPGALGLLEIRLLHLRRGIRLHLNMRTSAVIILGTVAALVAGGALLVLPTLPVLPKPVVSEGSTFRTFSMGPDFAWYEIGFAGSASNYSLDIRFAPSRSYTLGVALSAKSAADCDEAIATHEAIVEVDFENVSLGTTEHRVLQQWKAMYIPISPPAFTIRQENCTFYAVDGDFILSKLYHYRFVASLQTSISNSHDFRLILDGQG